MELTICRVDFRVETSITKYMNSSVKNKIHIIESNHRQRKVHSIQARRSQRCSTRKTNFPTMVEKAACDTKVMKLKFCQSQYIEIRNDKKTSKLSIRDMLSYSEY